MPAATSRSELCPVNYRALRSRPQSTPHGWISPESPDSKVGMGHPFEMSSLVASRAFRPLMLRASYFAALGAPSTVQLTIDDGPNPLSTPQILSTLAAHGVPATFFLTGARAEERPDLVQRIADDGHQVASHAYTHRKLTALKTEEIRDELSRAHAAILPFLSGERLFRPPHGERDARVDLIARDLGYRTILWNVNSKDWKEKYQPDGWVQHSLVLMKKCREANVLLHDLPTTAANLDLFLTRVKAMADVRFVAC